MAMWNNTNTEPDCIILLVGNKLVLVEKNNKKREVSYEKAKYSQKKTTYSL